MKQENKELKKLIDKIFEPVEIKLKNLQRRY